MVDRLLQRMLEGLKDEVRWYAAPADGLVRIGRFVEAFKHALEQAYNLDLKDKTIDSWPTHVVKAGGYPPSVQQALVSVTFSMHRAYGQRNEDGAHRSITSATIRAEQVVRTAAAVCEDVTTWITTLPDRAEKITEALWFGQDQAWTAMRTASLERALTSGDGWERALPLLEKASKLPTKVVSDLSRATTRTQARRFLLEVGGGANTTLECPLRLLGVALSEALDTDALRAWIDEDRARQLARVSTVVPVNLFAVTVERDPESSSGWFVHSATVLEPRIDALNRKFDGAGKEHERSGSKAGVGKAIIRMFKRASNAAQAIGLAEFKQKDFVLHLSLHRADLAQEWEDLQSDPDDPPLFRGFLCVTIEMMSPDVHFARIRDPLSSSRTLPVPDNSTLATIRELAPEAQVLFFPAEVWGPKGQVNYMWDRSAAVVVDHAHLEDAMQQLGLKAESVWWKSVLEHSRITRQTLRTRVVWPEPGPHDEAQCPLYAPELT
jgi:hypothetical protein